MKVLGGSAKKMNVYKLKKFYSKLHCSNWKSGLKVTVRGNINIESHTSWSNYNIFLKTKLKAA